MCETQQAVKYRSVASDVGRGDSLKFSHKVRFLFAAVLMFYVETRLEQL